MKEVSEGMNLEEVLLSAGGHGEVYCEMAVKGRVSTPIY